MIYFWSWYRGTGGRFVEVEERDGLVHLRGDDGAELAFSRAFITATMRPCETRPASRT